MKNIDVKNIDVIESWYFDAQRQRIRGLLAGLPFVSDIICVVTYSDDDLSILFESKHTSYKCYRDRPR